MRERPARLLAGMQEGIIFQIEYDTRPPGPVVNEATTGGRVLLGGRGVRAPVALLPICPNAKSRNLGR